MLSISSQKNWLVYIVRCADGSLYTGITNDLERRLKEHNESPLAARYTRMRRPVVLVHVERDFDRSTALKREAQIKRLSKANKERLFETSSC